MQRIMIVGQPGSGKSTLARQISQITSLPVVHMDQIHYKPGWIQRSKEEKDILCQEVHNQEHWIFEGGHSSTWPQRLERAHMLIWLDFPLWHRYRRVIWRLLRHYGQTRPDLPDNCPERFDLEFIRWIWNTRNTAKQNILQLYHNAPPQKQKYHLRNMTEVHNFLIKFTKDYNQQP